MIAQHRERTRENAVECLHCGKESRLCGNPRLSRAWRYCYADPKSLFQHKPGRKCPHKRSTPVIDNGKLTLRKSRRYWPTLAAPQRLIRPLTEQLGQHLTGATRAKDHKHRRSARLEQSSKPARYRLQVDDTVQWCKVRKRAVEKQATS